MSAMKAVVYSAPLQFRVQSRPLPEPGPREVRIRVLQAGVCGTDLHIHRGEYLAGYPLTPGHEVVGEVDSVGSDVIGVDLGTKVTVNPNLPCGRCDHCRSGRPVRCPQAQALGVTRDGFFAEFAVVPEEAVFDVTGLDRDTAGFAEPTACAVHGLERLSVEPGSSALVLGAGPTGLLLAQLLAAGGATSVTVAGRTAAKLETARALGADHTELMGHVDDDNLEAVAGRLRAASPAGDGYDVVVEATGATGVGELCVPVTRRGGTVLVYGVAAPGEKWRIEPFDMFRREISIVGSYAEMTSFPAAIAALRSGRVRTEGLITHRFALTDFDRALEAVAHDRTAHKVVVVP
jgi:D-arabinitol dehydrogenase (NADP+)